MLSAKDGDQNKLETEKLMLLFTKNNERRGDFCTAFIAEMECISPSFIAHVADL